MIFSDEKVPERSTERPPSKPTMPAAFLHAGAWIRRARKAWAKLVDLGSGHGSGSSSDSKVVRRLANSSISSWSGPMAATTGPS